MNITAVGIDLAKNVFHVHGVDERGGVVIKKKLNRNQILDFVRNLPQTLIGLEACGGAHYWGREFRACGHEVRMMAPQFVKPYVKANKNDMADAEAICEAVTRPNMRFVGIKEVEQQEVLMIHRIRSRLVRQRTALSNEIRGLLMEFGVTIPQGIWSVQAVPKLFIEFSKSPILSLVRNTQKRVEYGKVSRITKPKSAQPISIEPG